MPSRLSKKSATDYTKVATDSTRPAKLLWALLPLERLRQHFTGGAFWCEKSRAQDIVHTLFHPNIRDIDHRG
jgi:hypothetical protein